MVAHAEEAARADEGGEMHGVYVEGSARSMSRSWKRLQETWMATKPDWCSQPWSARTC